MKIQKIRVSVSKKVSKSENERVRASDDDQELSLKPDGPYCGLEGCQKARSIYYGKHAESESLLRPYGGDAQSMLVGLWMDWVCRRRERAARVWIERVCRCQTAVSSPLQLHLHVLTGPRFQRGLLGPLIQ